MASSAVNVSTEDVALTTCAAVTDTRSSFPVLRLSAGVALSDRNAENDVEVPPLGAVWAPFGDAPSAHAPQGLASRCGACGSFLACENGLATLRRADRSSLTWKCELCGRDNDFVAQDPRSSDALLTKWRSVVEDTIDYPAEPWATAAPSATGPAGQIAGPRGAVVVLVDEYYRQGEQTDAVVSAVTSIYRSAVKNDQRFAFMIYGMAVSVAAVPPQGSDAIAKGIVVLDTIGPDLASSMSISHKLSYFSATERHTVSLSSTAPLSELSNDRHRFMEKVFRAAITGQAKEYTGLDIVNLDHHPRDAEQVDEAIEPQASTPDTPLPRLRPEEEPRRLDTAIEVALELIQGVVDPEQTRIISFISGVPTVDAPKRSSLAISDVYDGDENANQPLTAQTVLSSSSRQGSGGEAVEHGLDHNGSSTNVTEEPEQHFSWIYSAISGLFYGPSESPVVGSNPSLSTADRDGDVENSTDEYALDMQERPEQSHVRTSSHELKQIFETIGEKAGELRVPLFFLTYGASEDDGCDMRALHAAASRSRGGMVYTAPHGFPSSESLCRAAVTLANWSTGPGLISLRASSPLVVERILGPAYETAAPDTFSVATTGASTGFGIILKPRKAFARSLSDSAPRRFATLQLVSKSLIRTRVTTLRIPITDDRKLFMDSIDPEAAAILLAKAAMADAGGVEGHSYKFAAVLDSYARKLIYQNPPVATVASLLFGIRRGPLVEAHVGTDESLVLRSMFQSAECTLASLLMSPRGFHTVTGASSMAEAPATSDLLTNSSAVVVLDSGATVFVWIGANADSTVEQGVIRSANDIVLSRGLAQCVVVRAGDEIEEVLRGYLTPKSIPSAKVDFDGLEDIPFMSFFEYVAMLRRAHQPTKSPMAK